MQKITFVALFIAFLCFDISGQTRSIKDEYEVYASVLEMIYEHNRETYSGRSEFVILNKTATDPKLDLPKNWRYKNLVNDFRQKNTTAEVVEKTFPRGAYSETYNLVSQSEVDELLEQGRKEVEKLRLEGVYQPSPRGIMSPFYRKFPEASGLYTLSRVGFIGSLAMVQVKGDLGSNGFSRTYILKRSRQGWQIISFNGSEWS